MYLIRQLAAKYNLTRTSLLHYDAIGLLCPSARTEAGYRLYSEEDESRLKRILLFRSMGIPLDSIKLLLETDKSRLGNALLLRLNELNEEIEELKQRQRNIINLFKDIRAIEEYLGDGMDGLANQILFKDIDRLEWHEQFAAASPVLHEEFLKVLDAVPEKVRKSIRASLKSLPKDERNRLDRLIRKK